MKYIDVSEWQGVIDWASVKGHVDGVILRAGYGSKGTPDAKFARNAAECNRLGIPCGAYWFSYAKSVAEAREEARHLLEAVKPYRMELPLAFDFEYDSVANARKAGVTVTKELASSFVRAFCTEVEAGGYWVLVYANPDYLKRYFDDGIPQRYGLWLANWPGVVPDVTKPPRKCAIWQWGGSHVPGIDYDVDTNESYTDFPTVIREVGCNHLDEPSAAETVTQTAPAADALKWAQSFNLTDDPALALALWRYHNTFHVKEDDWSIGTKP